MTERSREGEQRGEDTEKEERLPKELGNEDLSVTSLFSHTAQFSETRQISGGYGKVYLLRAGIGVYTNSTEVSLSIFAKDGSAVSRKV